mmetsp:Transcript_125559/g.366777  ORF Transcript_125559/g.366777 Transcript_125559/m.366777 type:complete len:211 (-) Transcript_125559:690-1322(-)
MDVAVLRRKQCGRTPASPSLGVLEDQSSLLRNGITAGGCGEPTAGGGHGDAIGVVASSRCDGVLVPPAGLAGLAREGGREGREGEAPTAEGERSLPAEAGRSDRSATIRRGCNRELLTFRTQSRLLAASMAALLEVPRWRENRSFGVPNRSRACCGSPRAKDTREIGGQLSPRCLRHTEAEAAAPVRGSTMAPPSLAGGLRRCRDDVGSL